MLHLHGSFQQNKFLYFLNCFYWFWVWSAVLQWFHASNLTASNSQVGCSVQKLLYHMEFVLQHSTKFHLGFSPSAVLFGNFRIRDCNVLFVCLLCQDSLKAVKHLTSFMNLAADTLADDYFYFASVLTCILIGILSVVWAFFVSLVDLGCDLPCFLKIGNY